MKKLPISFLQFVLLVHGMQVGTGILSLPRLLAEEAGTDGWISIILAWLLNSTFSVLIVLVMRQYPNDSLSELFIRLFGKISGKILIIPILFHFIYFGWNIWLNTSLYVKEYFLPTTNIASIMFIIGVPIYFIGSKHIQVIARYSQLIFYMTIWMSLVMLFPLKEAHYIHLVPVLKEGIMPVIKGIVPTVYSFLGYEVVYFVYPHLKQKELAIKGVLIASTLTMMIYVFVTLVCFVYFSPYEISSYYQPVLILLKVVEFRFLERFDIIFLAFYLLVVSKAMIPYTSTMAAGTAQLLGIHSHKWIVFIYIVAALIFTYFMQPSWMNSEEWMKWAGYSGIIVSYCLPIMLLIYIYFYKMARRKVA
ncbi:spore germination protein [Paenibacillus sp. N1-5-1-14]|uniref:GerAB/ArcD/ProY family transporter n=1 Tax=Paenibacillus radicibacter TaxID=2972488 RepID=UPI002158E630|nr:spore germination protein [Paenibacillus radicibacter]MCR8644694.1 spore germination protein [Paenibacillus radicibacter]